MTQHPIANRLNKSGTFNGHAVGAWGRLALLLRFARWNRQRDLRQKRLFKVALADESAFADLQHRQFASGNQTGKTSPPETARSGANDSLSLCNVTTWRRH
jgi:hypothetical protein